KALRFAGTIRVNVMATRPTGLNDISRHAMELLGQNVVVTANQFNPSIVTQFWLVKEGVASENEFEGSCIFTEGVSQVQTKTFQLVVVPQMLQFTPSPDAEKQGDLASAKVGKIVRALPHTPYTAIGLNF